MLRCGYERLPPGSRAALAGTALSTILALVACGQQEDAAAPQVPAGVPPLQAAVTHVRSAEVPIRLEVTGQIAAVSQATLSSQLQAAVEELRAREGTSVHKGDTLVVLDSRDIRADVARAKAEAENAAAHLARMKRLFAEDSVAKQELDNALRAFKVAEAGRKAALARLSYATIKAPFDGVITERKIEVGELASPGQPLLKLEDPTKLRLEATVAERDVKVLRLGAQMDVLIDALGPRPLRGTVSRIKSTGDPSTHTFLVKIDLPLTAGLKSGMFGRLLIETGTTRTLLVPRSAVIERGELTGVFAVDTDGFAHLRWVKTGRVVGEELEITSGLNAGERVLVEGAKGRDGARVKPVTAPSTVKGQ